MRKWMMFTLALSLVIASGCAKTDPAANTQAEQEEAVPVQVTAVQKGNVADEAGISGKLSPNLEVKVAPKVAGKIMTLPVQMGQQVSKGQVLYTLDQTDLKNAVEQAEAAYQSAVAGLNQSTTTVQQSIEQSHNSLTQAEQALKDAKTNEQRMSELFQAGAVASKQLEEAQTALKNAQVTYDNAQLNLTNAEKKTSIQVSQASVNQAKVALQTARENLGNSTVTSPISGIVAAVDAQIGEMASPQMAVVTVVDIGTLIAKVNLAENEITKVKVGDTVDIEIPTMGKNIKASVRSISPVMNQQVKAYPVEIEISNDKHELKADLVINVRLEGAKEQKEALIVPRKSVIEEQGKKFIYKIEGDTAKKVEITTGNETSDKIEIKTGLNEGDKIVEAGQTLLSDGAKVTIQ
ncbi:efflux RND transporter periplasmic adaptor subunit [Ammoniphilus resinae]|uniref:Multidrug efflux pump subunit AcrA (Membrane-fusion protein) n=1 Tax=Ammoniphilus resinae TaxID=861532 RepID=A0ABS4GMA3_9BACL|nr:efflux RND transporter periplasmic adaptor subunit [Ammoniphilus resinae]MBP1931384.1 multidrug efflux pump subunit AcrA (membrane-fusion protein) [Ammoniphilus resinae]